ncbi:MAG: glycerophosphodiester phosphodiesterase [Atopobiaceae bacterium]|nr:glycerophosphodiester phosphodiesterase [Atopobiaceae bacterium]
MSLKRTTRLLAVLLAVLLIAPAASSSVLSGEGDPLVLPAFLARWEEPVAGALSRLCGQHEGGSAPEPQVADDPHTWGAWTVTVEPSAGQPGERQRSCSHCGAVETHSIPDKAPAYTTVYEPATSWPMAATVAWRTDASAFAVAEQSVRPATAFIWLDANLRVFDRTGRLLATDLDTYIDATRATLIPAFYLRDAQTAEALKAWLVASGLQDCFVVSTPENKELVKGVADLLHVRGMLDYTAIVAPDRAALLDMVASTNGAHGKVILLSSQAATRENVKLLQRLASTVWVQSPADTTSLLTHYTNGVNGVVVDDFRAALSCEELFQDDEPSLLRVPLIIGHRGDPSSYVENTLDGARGAFEEGADAVENDIRLSADGEIFIFHDDTASTFMGLGSSGQGGGPMPVESMSLDELRSHPFLWSELVVHNEVSAERSRYGALYGQEEQKDYTVPTLREYLEAFKGTGLVHDIEIKSANTSIIAPYKALVDEYDAWDQVFTISFNTEILNALYRDYPELSIGALGPGNGQSGYVDFPDFEALANNEGTGAALKSLFGVLDQWNATYNPSHPYSHELMRAARHRGLTVWPWTYVPNAEFAQDFLAGADSLTYDWPWTVSNQVVQVVAQDATTKPSGVTRTGESRSLDEAELVVLDNMSEGGELGLWRYRADLLLGETSYGSYYLYSNPVVISTGQPAQQEAPSEVVALEGPNRLALWRVLAAIGAVCAILGLVSALLGALGRRRKRRDRRRRGRHAGKHARKQASARLCHLGTGTC